MSKESVVEIPIGSGNMYRYVYEDGKTRYVGPVGSAPDLGEEDFLMLINKSETNFTMSWRKYFRPFGATDQKQAPMIKVNQEGSSLDVDISFTGSMKHSDFVEAAENLWMRQIMGDTGIEVLTKHAPHKSYHIISTTYDPRVGLHKWQLGMSVDPKQDAPLMVKAWGKQYAHGPKR